MDPDKLIPWIFFLCALSLLFVTSGGLAALLIAAVKCKL